MTNKKQISTTGPTLAEGVDNPSRHIAEGGVIHAQPKTFFSAYSPKRKIPLTFTGEGRTKQSFKAECDINTIMARYQKTGLLEHVRQNQAQYLDVTGADFQDAQNLVAGANSMFHELPSAIRTKFDNSPARFLEFMENPANAQEAISMGLATAQEDSSNPPSGEVASASPAASTQDVAPSGKAGEGSKPDATKGA